MYTKFTNCPHCGEETEATFDIVEEGFLEGYENTCSICEENFTFLVQVRTEKV